MVGHFSTAVASGKLIPPSPAGTRDDFKAGRHQRCSKKLVKNTAPSLLYEQGDRALSVADYCMAYSTLSSA